MYTKASEECLKNAEHLLNDAKVLLKTRPSYGAAQSLCVTALEEMAKAIILEFANLNYIDKEVVNIAMQKHPPKKLVIEAFAKGELFVGYLDLREKDCEITMDKIKELKGKFFPNLKLLEEKRQNGLYVNVDVTNGNIISSPLNVPWKEVSVFFEETSDLLNEVKNFCEVAKYYRTDVPEGLTRNCLYRFKDIFGNFPISYDEA